ncbi:MAG TPA: ABC transporter ATP-binding protein [Alphaproteobacteria bacterium]|nr:ABC transporter ATP-binding protein [Alphaproteobacteria bacterium]
MGTGHIVLRGVRKSFGSTHAVENVSLTVDQNEFVTLLGPSGCGKTTLLRLIGGLERVDSGTILVGGEPVERTPARNRRTRMVFQHYALFPHMTVGQNVEFGLRVRQVPRAERDRQVLAALAMVQLSEKIDSKPSQLSGGQQQRVALARAIVTKPSVLLLDEPLAALDLQLRKAMQLELKTLQRELGITFIYVTHDQTEALAMSDRIVVMSEGRVEQVGSGREIYDRPKTPFVAQFVGEVNVFEAELLSVTHGLATVKLEEKAFEVALPKDVSLSVNKPARFIVRPERVAWRTQRPEFPALKCTVRQVLHLGSFARILAQTASGSRIMIDAPEPADLVAGDRIFAFWAKDAVRWL